MSELPSGWAETTIGNVLQFNYGKGLPERDRSGSGFPVYGSNGVVGYHEKAFVLAESLVVGRKGSVGAVHHSQGPCWPIDTTYFINEFAGMPVRFWYHALKGLDLSGLNRATAIPGLNREDAYQVSVALPPQTEQKRIADKLDAVLARVDACCERLDRVPTILKRFRQAVLAAATSGKLTEEWRTTQGVGFDTHAFEFADADVFRDYVFPQSWSRARLSDIASVVGGITKDAKKQLSEYVEVPYLRVANVQRGFFDLTEIKTIRVPQERLPALLLEPGDILFNEGGDIDKLGRGWVWDNEIEPCVFQNHVFRARLNDRQFSPRFFSWYGNSRGYDYFLSRGKQITNLASINKSVLSALPVPVPPAEEQDEAVCRVEALFAYADRLEARYTALRAKVERLRPALLAKVFSGELVPQDPNDEPASVLLERLRAARATAGETAGPKRRKGISRPKTSQKAEILMLTRRDIQDTHLTTILKERGPLTAEVLWSASQLDIDDFYDQLKDEEARGLLREKRGDSANAPRLLEAA